MYDAENCATEERTTKAVFNAHIARSLFLKGHKLVDFRPNRSDKHQTVFYFTITDEFLKDLEEARKAVLERRRALLEAAGIALAAK